MENLKQNKRKRDSQGHRSSGLLAHNSDGGILDPLVDFGAVVAGPTRNKIFLNKGISDLLFEIMK